MARDTLSTSIEAQTAAIVAMVQLRFGGVIDPIGVSRAYLFRQDNAPERLTVIARSGGIV